MSPLPETFDDITRDWLDAALRAGGVLDMRVSALEVEPLDPSKGLIGDLARLHVSYDGGHGPTSMICKLPAANPGSRKIGIMLQAYSREVAFYRYVTPTLTPGSVPICFYADEDVDAQRWVLVLEDCPADEFDFFAGATESQALAAVDALSGFHERWWQSDRFEWMPGFDTTSFDNLQALWFDNLPSFFGRYDALLPEEAQGWVNQFADGLAEWTQRAASEPLTMAHADYRIDNLLFHGDKVTMIDWQTAMRAPGAMDLSCFISTSLTVENRRRLEDRLIGRYVEGLERAGIALDRAWFAKSYDETLLWWMGQFGNNLAHLDPGDETVQRSLDAMVERVYTAAVDRNAGRLLN